MIRLSPDRSDQISKAMRRIAATVQDAINAPDTEAARKALNAVWNATHDAQQLINDAEREARTAALAKLENAA